MISKAQALKQAMEIPMPQAGEIIKIQPIEVFCAFMELHSLEIREWRNGFVVMQHVPALQAGKEE